MHIPRAISFLNNLTANRQEPMQAGRSAQAPQRKPLGLRERLIQNLDMNSTVWLEAEQLTEHLPRPLKSLARHFAQSLRSKLISIGNAEEMGNGRTRVRFTNFKFDKRKYTAMGHFQQTDNQFHLADLTLNDGMQNYFFTHEPPVQAPPLPTRPQPAAPARPDPFAQRPPLQRTSSFDAAMGRQTARPVPPTPKPADAKSSLHSLPTFPIASDRRTIAEAYERVKPRLDALANTLEAELHEELSSAQKGATPTGSLLEQLTKLTLDKTATLQQYEEAFGKDFQRIPNNGKTPQQNNNCFFISAQQISELASGRPPVGIPDAEAIESFRVTSEEGEEKPNQMVLASGALAKRFIDNLNFGKPPNKQIRVHVIQVLPGHVLDEVQGSTHPDAKESFIVDMGGHFEAFAVKPRRNSL